YVGTTALLMGMGLPATDGLPCRFAGQEAQHAPHADHACDRDGRLSWGDYARGHFDLAVPDQRWRALSRAYARHFSCNGRDPAVFDHFEHRTAPAVAGGSNCWLAGDARIACP